MFSTWSGLLWARPPAALSRVLRRRLAVVYLNAASAWLELDPCTRWGALSIPAPARLAVVHPHSLIPLLCTILRHVLAAAAPAQVSANLCS